MNNLTKTLTVKRSTFITNWSYKSKDGSTVTGTQNNQRLQLIDEDGMTYSETCTEIGRGDCIVNKCGWVLVRVSDDKIIETGWTVNEKSISRKWFKGLVKEGTHVVLIGRLV